MLENTKYSEWVRESNFVNGDWVAASERASYSVEKSCQGDTHRIRCVVGRQ